MRETDYEFGVAHERHLAAYHHHDTQVWCSNLACELSEDGMTVTFESEYGQGWYTPEECPRCHSAWVDSPPEREEEDDDNDDDEAD